MGWTDIIEGKWEEKDYTQDELDYKESLKGQYGFDDKTSRIIVKLKRNIYKDSRIKEKEKEIVFTRLLGGLFYGHEDNGLMNQFMWRNTAGSGMVIDYPVLNIKKQMLFWFNLTEGEYEYLKYKVRIQRSERVSFQYLKENRAKEIPGYKQKMEVGLGYKLTEDEFGKLWDEQINSFKEKTDFAHQYITMATHLYDKPRLADIMGGNKKTNAMSGWLGDTTNVADVRPSIGNDDYKADLDAVNITSIMEKDNISFIKASNKYYKNLENGTYNRAEEFKKNIDFEKVKKDIYEQLTIKRTDARGITIEMPSNINYIKENVPQTYNFVKSLENNQNDLKNYVDVK